MRNSNCDLCSLSCASKEVCIIDEGRLNKGAKIMVIADQMTQEVVEYSDVDENFKLKLFFDVFLKAITGTSRDDFYLTYLVKCYTDSKLNDIGEQVSICTSEYLNKEIELLNPKVIITLGQEPYKLLTGGKSIRGDNGELHYYNGIPVVPTFHPVFVQYSEDKLEYFAKDIYKAYNISRDIKVESSDIQYKVCKTIDDVSLLCKYIQDVGTVSFDFETTGLDFHKDKATVLGFTFTHGAGYIVPFEHFEFTWSDEDFRLVIDMLNVKVFNNRKITKIAHNVKFDLKFLFKYGISVDGPVWDTMLMHHLLDENKRHGLKEICREYFPEFVGYDDEVKKYKWSEIPLDILSKYCVYDTDLTLRLFLDFKHQLVNDETLYTLYRNLTSPAIKLLNDVEYKGMYVDRAELEKSIAKMENAIDKMELELKSYPQVKAYEKAAEEDAKEKAIDGLITKIEGYKSEPAKVRAQKKIQDIKAGVLKMYDGINFGSHKQLGELFYGDSGFQFPMPYVKGEGRKASTQEMYIMDFKSKTSFIDDLLEYRSMKKTLSTYLNGILERLDSDDYVHPTFKISGTVTGRLSCTNPNLQNIPRGGVAKMVKGLFKSKDKGYKIVQVDYSQAELRIAALLANDDTMLSIYKRDEDIHTATAKKVLGVDDQEWSKLTDAERKDYRTKAKSVNFGFLYGMGAKSFVEYAKTTYGVTYTEDEATVIRDNFFTLYSELPRWHVKYKRLCRKDGYVSTMFGRKRRLPQIYSADEMLMSQAERNAINSPVQGTGGELTIFAACLSKFRLHSSTQLINTVHDSLIYLVREDLLEQEIRVMRDVCENTLTMEYFGFDFKGITMKVDTEVGDDWGHLEEINI